MHLRRAPWRSWRRWRDANSLNNGSRPFRTSQLPGTLGRHLGRPGSLCLLGLTCGETWGHICLYRAYVHRHRYIHTFDSSVVGGGWAQGRRNDESLPKANQPPADRRRGSERFGGRVHQQKLSVGSVPGRGSAWSPAGLVRRTQAGHTGRRSRSPSSQSMEVGRNINQQETTHPCA
jgi:hypothetical protein